jgi:hypothetical protein
MPVRSPDCPDPDGLAKSSAATHDAIMQIIRAAVFAALCAALAACASKPTPPPAPPKPAVEVDGYYRGTSTRFQAESRACPHPGLVDFQVIQHQFQYRWDYKTFVLATIAPDGTVSGGAERITLVGKQDGPLIDGDVTNGECGLHFTVKQHPNP